MIKKVCALIKTVHIIFCKNAFFNIDLLLLISKQKKIFREIISKHYETLDIFCSLAFINKLCKKYIERKKITHRFRAKKMVR